MLASCSGSKKAASARKAAASASPQPVFLENISIKPRNSDNTNVKKPPTVNGRSDLRGSLSTDIEKSNSLQFKYSILMDQPVEAITNEKMIDFLDEWYGIPYKYGGGSKLGIDCSAFSSLFLSQVFNLNIPRTTKEQYAAGERIGQDELEQGDLVFFNTIGRISHVGVYLGRHKFVHASSSNGVIISDLDEAYYEKRYAGARRIR
jgi:cell wall-associated NlpC family hydrolase